jgi:hypothetical protein
MNDEGLELLRALLERIERRHTAPRRKPARYYLRRDAHRTLPRFAGHTHNRCR